MKADLSAADMEQDVKIFKTVIMALGLIAAAAAPAVAQSVVVPPLAGGPQKVSVQAPLSAEWLIGRWSAPRMDEFTVPDLILFRFTEEYWLDVEFTRLPGGWIEAEVTARQMADHSEFVTWKADVTIGNNVVTLIPRQIVGKQEWWLHAPDTYQLMRRGDRLVGRYSTSMLGIEMSSGMVTLER
jgi:hypothetical protein